MKTTLKANISKMIFTTALVLVSTHAFAQSLDQNVSKQGTYEVPVDDPSLTSSAVFPLRKVQVIQTGSDFKVKYVVPIELTGLKNTVEFTGTINNGQGSLTYDQSKMDCLSDQGTLMCKVAYQNLKIDQGKAEQILASKFQGDELQRRLSVLKDFSTDPIGIVKVKLK